MTGMITYYYQKGHMLQRQDKQYRNLYTDKAEFIHRDYQIKFTHANHGAMETITI